MNEARSGKVPVIECVKDAWRFTMAEAGTVVPAALVVAVASAAGGLFAMSGGAGVMLALFIDLLAGVVFAAAVLRIAVRRERPRGAGVSFGNDELRLLGVSLALALLFVPLGMLILIVIWTVALGRAAESIEDMDLLMSDPDALAEALAASLGPSGQLAFSLLMILFCVAVVIIAARLVMVNAATIGEQRMVIFQTWSWSRGNVLRIIGAMLLTLVPALLVGNIIVSIIQTPLAGREAGGISPLEVMLFGGASGFVSAYVNLPALALAATLYRGLRPPDFVAK